MSKQSIDAFWEKVRQDSGLQLEVGKRFQSETPIDQIVALAAQHGEGFTNEELTAYLGDKLSEFNAPGHGELSEEALENVAGGVGDLVVNINIGNLNLPGPSVPGMPSIPGTGGPVPAGNLAGAINVPASGMFPPPPSVPGW